MRADETRLANSTTCWPVPQPAMRASTGARSTGSRRAAGSISRKKDVKRDRLSGRDRLDQRGYGFVILLPDRERGRIIDRCELRNVAPMSRSAAGSLTCWITSPFKAGSAVDAPAVMLGQNIQWRIGRSSGHKQGRRWLPATKCRQDVDATHRPPPLPLIQIEDVFIDEAWRARLSARGSSLSAS